MVQDAEQNAAADKEKSEQIDIKNQSEALCYQTKKQLENLKQLVLLKKSKRLKT